MRLKFTELVIREFKSFQGEHVLDLALPAGVHYVRGKNRDEPRLSSNGSGKTTLWDALVWCLFGRTPLGLRNPDVVPWSGRKGTRVIVRFAIDGAEHRVTRTASPNSLKIDGKDAGPDAVAALIGMSFPLLTATIVMGQGADLFFDMSPTEKMELLSDVLGLERWDVRSKGAAQRVAALEVEHATYTAEVAEITRAVKDIDASMAELRPKEQEWQTAFDARRDEVEKFCHNVKAQMQALQHDVDTLDLKYDGAMAEVKGCEQSVARLITDAASARLALARFEDAKTMLERRIDDLTADLKKLVDVKRCPTCNLVVSHQDMSKHRDEIKRERSIVERKAAAMNPRPLKRALETAEKARLSEERYLASFHAKADGALRDHGVVKGKLIALQEREREIKRSFNETEVNPYAAQLRTLKKRKSKRLADLDTAEQDVTSCAKELEETKPWTKGFKDVKLHLLEEMLQDLELVTLGMLEEVGLVGWDVRYVIERENKSGKVQRGLAVMIGSPRSRGKLVRWESWSGGEGQRLRVVGSLALSSVLLNHAGVSPNIEVLDEPTKYVSEGGISDLCAFLSERAKAHNLRIFYCDHQSVDAGSSSAASTIVVRRDRSGSSIVQRSVSQ